MVNYYSCIFKRGRVFFVSPKNSDITGNAIKIKSSITKCQVVCDFDIDVIFVTDSKDLKNPSFSEKWNKFCSNKTQVRRNPCIIASANTRDDIKRTLFDNTNIWIRHVKWDESEELIKEEIEKIYDYFKLCYELKLYEQDSAEEYIDYHLRIQKENHLSGDHKDYVYPYLYASEDIDLNENIELNPGLKSKVYFRILLIEDKLGNANLAAGTEGRCSCKHIEFENNELKRSACSYYCNDDDSDKCKLKIIKDLLELKRNTSQHDKIYWKHENIQSFYFSIEIDENIDYKFNEMFLDSNSIQIFGVKDVKTAKAFLKSKDIKFDLILLDYLLGEKVDNNVINREFGTELLSFLGTESPLKNKILSNASLGNRLWLFPITAFAPTFLNYMQSERISLLTNNWYIYYPTNPIVTPNQFLRNLNEFIGMMVDRSVYTPEDLLGFFNRSSEKVPDKFEKYVSFMGAEYQRFIQLYGSRSTITRDKDVSLFAKSVYDEFYTQEKNSKAITLNNHLRKFYYASTFLVKEREGWEQLRKTWDILSKYIFKYFNEDIIKEFDKRLSTLIQELINKPKY